MKQTRTEERKGATYNFCITGNHDDGYLRRTNTEEVKRWGLNQNEWLQSALQIRMAYSSVVRSMRSLGRVNIWNKRKRNSSRRSAESILGAYCLHSYRSRPRWWVSSPNRNESWVWITTNGCNQLCKYEWLIIRPWLVGWIRPLRVGHSFSLFQIKEKQTDRAEVLTVTEQDCKTIDEFASSQLAPSDPRLSRPETRVDESISRTVMCVTWMNEWMRDA